VLILKFIATLSSALFAGAALYITLVEQPVRAVLEARAALAQWAPSYQRATLLQAPLALVSLAAGLGAWLTGAGALWALAAVLIGAVVPFTLVVIMRTNRALLSAGPEAPATLLRALLSRWGALHAVRTLLSLTATLLYIWLDLAA